MTATLTAPAPTRPAFDVAAWLCDWCGNVRDPERGLLCPCAAATHAAQAEVRARHRDAVARAHRTTRLTGRRR